MTDNSEKQNQDYEISVVIPAYQERGSLPLLVEKIRAVLETDVTGYEIIVVDDGSVDGTFDELVKMHAEIPGFKGVRLSRNFGKEAALYAGLQHASGEAVITLDADLQHPPELITHLLEEWRAGAEIVHGVKQNRSVDSFLRRFLARMFNSVFSHGAGFDLRGSSDFKLLDRRVVNLLCDDLPERKRFYRGLSSWVGFRQTSVKYDVVERSTGDSRWETLGLVRYAVENLTSFSSLPLALVPLMGVLMLIVSLFLGVEAIVSKVSGNSVSGFATLEITVLFTGSMIMIGLGIIGNYLARIFDELKHRPISIVAEKIGF